MGLSAREVAGISRGVSLRGLHTLASRPECQGCSVNELWYGKWYPKLLPQGWTAQQVDGYVKAVFTKTGEATDQLPEGTESVLEHFVSSAMLGPPTHFVSFPGQMLFTQIVEAVESILHASKEPVFVWMDVLSIGYYDNAKVLQSVIDETRQVVQVPPHRSLTVLYQNRSGHEHVRLQTCT